MSNSWSKPSSISLLYMCKGSGETEQMRRRASAFAVAYVMSTIIPCAGSNNAYVSWQCKALKEQIMHSFYDNAAYAIIIIIIKEQNTHFS